MKSGLLQRSVDEDAPNFASVWLHLGCGLEAPADWLNVDGSFQAAFARWPRLKRLLVAARIYPRSQAAIKWPRNVARMDLRRRLPFENERFDAIYSSHTFEHLYRDQAAALARECFRVLRPGGVCRILVPDLAAAIARYHERTRNVGSSDSAADQLMEELLLQPRSRGRGALAWYHRVMNVHQHKWMYDAASLSSLLKSAGFRELRVYTSTEGELPGLRQIEQPSRIENGAGIAVEGKK